MLPDELPELPAGAERIPFAQASARRLAQALVYANQRLEARFPALDWSAWNESFQLAQPQLVVQGPAVWLEWPALARLVQGLTQAQAKAAPDPPVFCVAAAELSAQVIDYDTLARKVRLELAALPDVSSPLLNQLLEQLTSFNATAWHVYSATREVSPEVSAKPELPEPPAPVELLLAPPTGPPAEDSVSKKDRPLAPTPAPLPAPPRPPLPEGRQTPARRTFRDIVKHHPRANGKQGFTVRELCGALRISAASLQEAHGNPGRLSLNSLSALAALMHFGSGGLLPGCRGRGPADSPQHS